MYTTGYSNQTRRRSYTPGHRADVAYRRRSYTQDVARMSPIGDARSERVKTHYIRRALQLILDVTDSKSINVIEVWKKFSIKHCIDIISLSLKELKTSTLNACWKKILRSSVEIENVFESSEHEIGSILELAKSIGGEGFVDMTIEDVQDLLVEAEVDEANLMEMASKATNDQEGFAVYLVYPPYSLDIVPKRLPSFYFFSDTKLESKEDCENCLVEFFANRELGLL
ncbi:hypothetical protein M0804_012821 [Polistes exclamans]|nr:hypothetical protein M0804_012821 [Polistes exclamans]